ncbi:fungal-specific transcription factor domain-containing protein [Xylogone sp. PMI_703]|nr:fungal-specific transcription factor domain-containing protein [Xylogone sp. PMI_703]
MEPSASPSASTILPIEIGSLSASSPNESQFFGSSSGVFFVNTVFRAFAASRQGSRSSVHPTQHTSSPGQASVDNCIVDQSDDFLIIHDEEVYTHKDGSLSRKSYGVSQPGLGRPPSVGIAKELIISYFEKWHPLFPFLHGPTILEEVELFYSNDDTPRRFTTSQLRENTRRAIIFQCIFNIAALDRPDITLSPASKIESPASLMSFLGILAVKHDTPSLQALLAAQLYLMAVMALQAASTVGGMLVRNIFHAGFHRCPARYVQLSGHDCDIRKRIFWCVYATDRYLSQSLGHPVSIQDKDLDVCIPGTKELHRTVPRATPAVASRNTENEVLQHLPNGHPASSERLRGRDETQSTQDSFEPESSEVPGDAFPQSSAASKIFAEGILANYVGYCRVTGRILDLFHKSIQNRSVENDNILVLTSEVHEWWNSLPQELQDYRSIQTGQAESLPSWAMKFCSSQGPFFTMIYQQLILLINRPFLSMDPAKPAFRSSLQTCISASRTIISTLKQVISHKQCISLPGTLSSAWMSGLVIAFACELSMYPFNKGIL